MREFAPIPRRCSCGQHRVDTTDHAGHAGGLLVVHGLAHCFTTASLLREPA